MTAQAGDQVRVSPEELYGFIVDLLRTQGVPVNEAEICALVLREAELTGRSTHAISRLPMYFSRIRQGLINVQPKIVFHRQWGALAQVDGDNGLGPVVAYKAMEESLAIAEQMGMGGVFVKASNHCGAMSVYCSEAAGRGYVMMCLTNSPPAIPPWGGREAYFGTNPIAFGFPRHNQRHIIVDLATSVVARGNIIQAARLNQPIPDSWALTQEGQVTTDPNEALKGLLLPMAGAKGYALALAVEMFSGVLSHAGFGTHVHSPYEGHGDPSDVGHFFMAIKPEALMRREEYDDRVEKMVEEILGVKTMESMSIRLPGERGHCTREEYMRSGIPLDAGLVTQLESLAKEHGIHNLVLA